MDGNAPMDASMSARGSSMQEMMPMSPPPPSAYPPMMMQSPPPPQPMQLPPPPQPMQRQPRMMIPQVRNTPQLTKYYSMVYFIEKYGHLISVLLILIVAGTAFTMLES